MSKEYICREEILKTIDEILFKTDQKSEEQIGVLKCRAAIREMESADVAEVVHGEWKNHRCNACGDVNPTITEDFYGDYISNQLNYCPNCGGKNGRRESQ